MYMVAYIHMIYPDTKLEEKLWKEGYKLVLGIDEAGRGPLAGPVVAGGVVINSLGQVIPNVRDSKKMTEKQRNEAYYSIKKKSLAYGIGIIGPRDIDGMGIQKAVLQAMTTVLEIVERKLNKKIDYIIADGMNILPIKNYKMKKIKGGDLYHYCIAAGSVLAKVTRDKIMRDYHIKYPKYGFDTHVGYGTKKHMEALKKYGVTKIHRRSFKPVRNFQIK
jgi:ribonuclease HII